jgi:hypothetical protein
MTELSPLRRRMIDDMTIRNLSPATQRSYLHAVTKFSRYFGRSPDRLGLEDVRAWSIGGWRDPRSGCFRAGTRPSPSTSRFCILPAVRRARRPASTKG